LPQGQAKEQSEGERRLDGDVGIHRRGPRLPVIGGVQVLRAS
jgi:hypothetical protein